MTQKEKLTKLLDEAEDLTKGLEYIFGNQVIADHLIKNGVVVLPCRCKDCKYSNTDHAISVKRTWCDYWGIDPDFADFCPYGERKGGE